MIDVVVNWSDRNTWVSGHGLGIEATKLVDIKNGGEPLGFRAADQHYMAVNAILLCMPASREVEEEIGRRWPMEHCVGRVAGPGLNRLFVRAPHWERGQKMGMLLAVAGELARMEQPAAERRELLLRLANQSLAEWEAEWALYLIKTP